MSTRENIVNVRRNENRPPRRQVITTRHSWIRDEKQDALELAACIAEAKREREAR